VHAANVQDRDGAKRVRADLAPQVPRRHHRWADQGDTGPLRKGIERELGGSVDSVARSPRRGFPVTPEGTFQQVSLSARFEPLPRRWGVERTLARTSRHRRMRQDYERLPATTEALGYLTGPRLLLARLAKHQP
jgi:putative transposase